MNSRSTAGCKYWPAGGTVISPLCSRPIIGLRELLLGAYYGQPQHWPALQYQPLEFNPYE